MLPVNAEVKEHRGKHQTGASCKHCPCSGRVFILLCSSSTTDQSYNTPPHLELVLMLVQLTSGRAATARLVALKVAAAVSQLLRNSAHCKENTRVIRAFTEVCPDMSGRVLTERRRGVGPGAACGQTPARGLMDVCGAGGP